MEIKYREIWREFNKLMERTSKVYANDIGYQMGQKYIKGLLGSVERKNGWQLSEYLGETTPYAVQQFIYRGRYSSDSLRDELRGYVSDEIGEADGLLVIDDTGFLKQGKESCGVKRQYSGTAGRIENCQIGVFLTYASKKGHSPIDRRLYMPEEWMTDSERRKKAGVPESLEFKTKPQIGLEMIQEATTAGVMYQWVTGDCAYGDYRDIRLWLEQNKKNYVMSVSGKEYIIEDFQQVPVSQVLKNQPAEGWFEASCGDGSKGARMYDWQVRELEQRAPEGFRRAMLIRRSQTKPSEIRAYICFAPINTPDQKFVEIAGTRWTVESCFKESKSEVGLDQYEFRSYDGWHKHITFACLALALLTVLSSRSLDTKSIQEHNPATSSLDEFKKGRNLRV